MCKELFKGLLGGGAAKPTPLATPVGNVADSVAAPIIKNSDLLASSAPTGTDPSGRVKIGTSPKRSSAVVAGLSL